MRILIPILATIAVYAALVSAITSNSSSTESKTTLTSSKLKTTKLIREREKRTIDQFGNYYTSNPYHFGAPKINKRISTGYHHEPRAYYQSNSYADTSGSAPVLEPLSSYSLNAKDPLLPSYIRDFDAHGSNYISEQQHYQQQPQYLEAPEPIIEIIIKESNETLPVPQAQFAIPQKKAKEQVQVFYVKYKKDEHRGLVIDDPVPALSPEAYHQEKSEESEDLLQDQPYAVTVAPPLKTTTLRTIIHPDSERYHSNSGIQVTFNSEDKRQSGRHYQEHIEASALQPVIAQPAFPEPRNPQYHQTSQQQSQQYQSKAFDHQSRFDLRNPNGNAPQYHQQQQHRQPHQHVSLHQELPHPHASHLFREDASTQFQQTRPAQQNRYYQQHGQNSDQHHQHKQNFGFSGPESQFLRQSLPNQQPAKFRPAHPIAIPIHSVLQQQPLPSPNRPPSFAPAAASESSHHQQHQQQSYQQQQQQSYNKYQEFSKPQPSAPPSQYRIKNNGQPQSYSQFQDQTQYQQQQIQHLRPVQQTYAEQSIQGGGLVQQVAPNLSLNKPAGHEIFNQVVTGAELVASVPKYEQHITQTIPFGQPITPFELPPQFKALPSQTQSSQQQQQEQQEQQLQTQQRQQQQQQEPQKEQQSPSAPPQQQHALLSYDTYQQQYEQQQKYQQQQSQKLQQQSLQLQQQHQQLQKLQPVQQQYIAEDLFRPATESTKLRLTPQGAGPIQQHLVPGQSVSTLASEVFPSLESQLYRNQPEPQQYQNIDGRNRYSASQQTVDITPAPASKSSPTQRPTSKQPTTTTEKPETTTKKISKAQFDLPDEVPDELRQQLLSSGILDNADISVLDYDKIGDVPLESLPAEHLANFYGGGGAAQLSSSNKVVTVVKPNGDRVLAKKPSKSELQKPLRIVAQEESENNNDSVEQEVEEAAVADEAANSTNDDDDTLPKKQNVDLKVVRFDSNSQKSVTDKYIKPDSAVLPSVDVSDQDQQYNRYLPLKVNGAQFPIPDVKELKGRKISSVVVLAPVDNLQLLSDSAEGRFERDIVDTKHIKFVAGDSLKQLLKKPTKENFKRWLDKESKTEVDLQSVVLLVTQNEVNEKEIYMYDISTQNVNKLSGELSSAFVNVAEENANAQDIENVSISDSGIVEQMVPKGTADENSASEMYDSEPQSSDTIETFVRPPADFHQHQNDIVINSGYSSIS